MSEFERKDDLPAGADSVPVGSDSNDAGDDFEVVVSDDPEPSGTPVAGDDGVPGGDDGAEANEADNAPEEQKGPKSRSARVRERLRQQAEHAMAAAQALHQQNQQLAARFQAEAMARAQLEAQAVENRFMYLQQVQQQLTMEKRRAMDEGRSDDISRIDTTMMQLAPELHQVAQRRGMLQNMRPQQTQPMPQMPPQQVPQRPQPQARLHEAAEKWANEQTAWLNADPSRLNDARSIAQRLESQGYTPDEPDYYDKLNAALKAIHSDFRPVNPVRPGGAPRAAGPAVAGVTRSSTSPARQTRQVALTAEEMAFCERHGINPKSYGREKLASHGNGR